MAGDGTDNAKGIVQKSEDFITRSELDQCLSDQEQKMIKAMNDYQHNFSKLMVEHIHEMKERTNSFEKESIISRTKLEKTGDNLKYFVMGIGVAICVGIATILLVINDSQNAAFTVGHDMRASTRSMVEATESKTQREISTLKEKIDRLEVIIKNDKKDN